MSFHRTGRKSVGSDLARPRSCTVNDLWRVECGFGRGDASDASVGKIDGLPLRPKKYRPRDVWPFAARRREGSRIDAALAAVEGRLVENRESRFQFTQRRGKRRLLQGRRRKMLGRRERESCLGPSDQLSCPIPLPTHGRTPDTYGHWLWPAAVERRAFRAAIHQHAASGVRRFAAGLAPLDYQDTRAFLAELNRKREPDNAAADYDYVPILHLRIVEESVTFVTRVVTLLPPIIRSNSR